MDQFIYSSFYYFNQFMLRYKLKKCLVNNTVSVSLMIRFDISINLIKWFIVCLVLILCVIVRFMDYCLCYSLGELR